ncbi:N-acetylmuramidase domain-containing protein [Azospirillum sp. TSH64]|uniref:N-acetylmuramidase domain-containing protein n=1 Tax=Azospirillum sp. TSH64 TaxID=652740 RepID=UPI000D6168BF|nr:N-acetylmuramidase domain-containing protein [Azospirillum sp. TSH64]PWC81239.1 hypothetical protein TSH64_00915 [Azospirillum sp. TSH64]
MSSARLPFAGAARPLVAADIEAAARALGCLPAVVRAVLAVEAGGAPFLPDGRPKILFEAHVFSRLTRGRFNRSNPAVSAPKWDRSLYRGGAGEYERLLVAMRLDREAALKAASWGAFQILGSNHAAAGYAEVEAFVEAHSESAGNHLAAFVAFVRSSKLDDELRRAEWARFAESYNGPGYRANAYDVRLASAFTTAIRRELDPAHAEIAAIQAALNAHGAALTVDGFSGPKTQEALQRFQAARGFNGAAFGAETRLALGVSW